MSLQVPLASAPRSPDALAAARYRTDPSMIVGRFHPTMPFRLLQAASHFPKNLPHPRTVCFFVVVSTACSHQCFETNEVVKEGQEMGEVVKEGKEIKDHIKKIKID